MLKGILLLLAICVLGGLITGEYGWSLAFGLALYVAWTLRELLRLHHWLRESLSNESAPPSSRGLLGEVFDGIYQLQRHHARSLGRMQALIERIQTSTRALKDAVIMLDERSNLEWWNPAAETLLGLKLDQDTGQPITNLLRHPQFVEYFKRGVFHEPLELPSPVNKTLTLQFEVTVYGNHQHLLIVRNVSHFHQLEQMRKDFVSNVSHELRTPLTVIVGYLETLLDNSGQIDPRWQRALQQMHGQSTRMQNLLNDLLLLAKLESTEFPSEIKPVAIEQLLKTILNDARALSGQRQHQLSLEAAASCWLMGNEAELHSAFSNLVFNAVKYTPDNGSIRIRWWCDTQGGHLSVEDSGVGIEPRHIPRLVERFYRVDSSRSSRTGGTGLGLAIVKHVLLRHHGRLEIHSQPGQGSTFLCHFSHTQLNMAPQLTTRG